MKTYTYKIISGAGVNVTPKNFYRKSAAGRIKVAKQIAEELDDTTFIINEVTHTMSNIFAPKSWNVVHSN